MSHAEAKKTGARAATAGRRARAAAAARAAEADTLRAVPGDAAADGQKGHLELRVWLRLLGCTGKIESVIKARLRKEFGTSLARFDLLAQLDRFPEGLTMSDVSRRLMVSNGAITGLVDKLVAEAFVTREVSTEDRRTAIVRLTPQGRAVFLRMARRHEEWVVSLLGEMSREAQSELLQNLTLLKRTLDLQLETPDHG